MNRSNTASTPQTIQACFQYQVQRVPDRLCIRVPKSKADEPWELTYCEMDRWSDALAGRLQEAGVVSGDCVGLCVERSAAAIAAMLAVVKVGGCYVPISPDYPKARAELMVADTGLQVAFATPIFANKMKRVGVNTLLLEERPQPGQAEPKQVIAEGHADDSAYIIYTSGSTGRPKGVEVPHRGILRLVSPQNSYCQFDQERRFLQLAPLFFDAATFEVWGAVLNGACCVVQPGDGVPDPELLAQVLSSERITTLWLTSSLFNWLIDNNALVGAPVKELLVGGEALSIAHIRRAQQELPDTQLINGYGPTETTTFACCYPIPRPVPEGWSSIPIGPPIFNTRVFVCDEQGHEVEQGEQGELLIAGDGVALGYRGLPELSAERFKEKSLGEEHVYVYCTGDQVRLTDDGLVEYLGRIDDQVKISGYRIELGEISSCLTSHAEVRDAAVIVHSSDAGDRRLVSYLVAQSASAPPAISDIRSHVQQRLPHYMVPNSWVFIDQLPLTANGKLDREALPEPVSERPDIGVDCVVPKDAVEQFLVSLWKEHLGLGTVGVNDRYFELGGTSIGAVNFVAMLGKELNQRIPIATFFYAPTIRSFATALWSDYYDVMAGRFPELVDSYRQEEEDLSQYQDLSSNSDDDIAIIGLAGRFPGADDTDGLWENLENGVESLRFATDAELRSAGVSEDDIADPEYVRAYFSVDDLEFFDASFFGYQPREAEIMDPQHRMFLELAWTALDNAGYGDPDRYAGKIGVFGGTARDAYVHHYVSKHPIYGKDLGEFYVNMGNDKNFPPTRVAYKLNLKGPAVNVQTACSTAGTALHLASQSLKAGECDMVVVGGCRGLVPAKAGYRHVEEGALSADGHLRAFDANASGMVRGSGAAFVVIKRLGDAIKDGDCVRAVIKATAINNDGNAKVGYTAPSVEGQADVITRALVKSGVPPESIGYVEAHGTGTLLGDPIEVTALTKSYRRFTDAKGFCRIGSVKTNIGHLDAGSAVAGIIKTVLSMEHGQIPASLNFSAPNPNIDFANSPFVVSDQRQPWPVAEGQRRYAGVSSFGLGGTNFHAILEQAPDRQRDGEDTDVRPCQLVTLSAKTATSLNANIASFKAYCKNHPDRALADVAFSVNAHRPQYKERAILVSAGIGEQDHAILVRQSAQAPAAMAQLFVNREPTVGMAQALYRGEPTFRKYVNLCAGIFASDHGIDVLEELYPQYTESAGSKLVTSDIRNAARFCIEYALAKLWISWTGHPALVIANGGAVAVAACIADMLSVHKAIEVTVALGQDERSDDASRGHTALDNVLQDIIPAVAKVPLVSGLTGKVIEIPDLMSTECWLAEAADAATLAASIAKQEACSALFCVDMSCPDPSHSIASVSDSFGFAALLPTEHEQQAVYRQLLRALGQAWLAGHNIDWHAYYTGQHVHKVPLPTFKFDRSRYLIDLPERVPQLLLFEASNADELQGTVAGWKDFVQQTAAPLQEHALPWSDKSQAYRLAIAANTPREMSGVLSDSKFEQQLARCAGAADNELVFLLPGGGAQYLQMGKGLYERHQVFRATVDEGFSLFAANSGEDLRRLIFPAPAQVTQAETDLTRPSLQLPAIFIIEVALARLWMHWGATPAALIGHSMGENTAACLAGVISFDDALGLVSLRGSLFEQVEPGGMLSVALPADQAQQYLGEELDLATVNGPGQSTISGPRAALEQLRQRLEGEDIDAQLIPIDIAAHSRYLDPIMEAFRDYLASIELRSPQIPFISNSSGTWITDEQATDPDYWVHHLRGTVQFSQGVQTLLKKPGQVFLEVGPGKILGSLVKLHDPKVSDQVLASLRHNQEDIPDLVFSLNTLGKLWSLGIDVQWRQIDRDFPGTCIRLPLQSPAGAVTANVVLTPTTPVIADLPQVAMQATSAPVASVLGPPLSRREYIKKQIKDILYDMSGIPAESIDGNATFVDLGFDSLFLTQANGRMKKAFKVKVTLRQLMSDAPSVEALAEFIDNQLPEDALQDELNASAPAATAPGAAPVDSAALAGLDTNSLTQILATQIQTSNALLAALQGGTLPATIPAAAPAPATKPLAQQASASADKPAEPVGHGPFRPIVKSVSGELTEQQRKFLDEFIETYAEKTKGSKQIAAAIRPHYADPRTVLGFKTLWKEITYSIVAERSKGGRVWDVDGNEYVDCMGGFGAIFFGHAPDFVMDAVRRQADITVDYGPQSAEAGEVARLICEMTGMDRASFCNTGSEAVLAAVRIARTVTGNDLIVTFSGDYHGVFDEMLIRSQVIGGNRKNQPIAPGIPQSSSSNILMLDYDNPESLEIIKERAEEIAGVLIEPIQSRHPEIQPREFIHQLREITRKAEIPMIFDEIITGFRLHPRGAQAWFDVDVDIACYGKVIGGGLPIGVVAGKSAYIDLLDGGPWQYGDDSFPEAGVTYFAGTFVRHPLAIAAAHAVVKKLKEEGPALQQALNLKTSLFAERVNRHYRQQDIPVELIYFGSVFLVRYRGESDYEFLYFLNLRHYGAHHIWGPRPGFMTTAHTEEDVEFLINAFVEAGNAMRRGGFFHTLEERPEESYPWTSAQSELWLACELGDAASAAYNEQVIFEIDNTIDKRLMEFAVDRAINKHPSLRAVVAEDKQGMVVKHYMSPELHSVDLSDHDASVAESEYMTLAAANVDKAFDFANGPLLRVLLVKLADAKYRLCVAASHLVCDGWSLEKVMEDIAGYYTAISQGRHYRGRPAPALADFYKVEQVRLASEEFTDAREFWSSVYRNNIPPLLELPLDHPRPRFRKFNGERHEFRFDNSVMQPLRAYAKAQGCTTFVLLLTAFNVLLSRLSGQQEVVVGVPAAGQPNIGMPNLVAHNVSFLPLRTRLDGEQDFEQLLLAVRDGFLDAKDNQDFAFGDLLQTLHVPREPGRLPLVSANFNLDMPFNELDFDGVSGECLTTPRNYVKYDLSFNLTDEGDFLRLEVDRCSDLFDADTVTRWVQSYLHILQNILRAPNTPVVRLSLSDDSENELIVKAWNATSKDYPLRNSTLHGLVAAMAASTPATTAVMFEQESLSYEQLDSKANQLAHYLRAHGVVTDQPVALLMDRALLLPVSMLAILKAGGAYLPLDADFPQERIHYILQEAGVKQVLVDQGYLERVPQGFDTIAVDAQWSEIAAEKNEPLDCSVMPDNLAYVIYTSGSTGKPKGVMIEHRAICNRLFWMQEDFQLGEDDRILQKTPYTFDVSVWEFFLPLMAGATLVMARPGGHKDSDYLVASIAENTISHVHFVPSMLYSFLANPQACASRCLRRVVCSGEALSRDLQDQFFDTFPSTELYNYYGPTEAAVDVTAWQCQPDDNNLTVPIGRAVANTQIYILDDFMQPVPFGSAGELYIGGVQVARGYISRDELTRERFVADPFSDRDAARLYKTGDLARYRDNGVIEYLGRNDFQVKVRGLRIELGEIEVALERHADIDRAVVVAREARANDTRLVAYLVADAGSIPEFSALRDHLLTILPEYMIPQHFVELDEVPLTSSGKVDRKALPAPVLQQDSDQRAAPKDDTEREVTAHWCQILGMEDVGVTDDFFELGGHSLLGTQLFAKLNAEFSATLGLKDLFIAPTIRQQAALIKAELSAGRATLPAIRRYVDREGPPPASSQQQRLWYLEQIEPDSKAYNLAASFRLIGKLDVAVLQQVFEIIVARHAALRTNFTFADGGLLQIIRPQMVVDLQPKMLPDDVDDSTRSLHRFLKQQAARSFDLTEDALFQPQLFGVDDEQHVLFLLIHHLVFDGWSFDVILHELCVLYNALIKGDGNSLPELPVQYSDYAIWQREYLQTEQIEQQLQYWMERLSGQLPILALPEDYPRPAEQPHRSDAVLISLTEFEVADIEEVCKELGCTLFMLLVSVYSLLLYRYSRQQDIIIGAPVSGRGLDEISSLLGFFVNTVVFRFSVAPDVSFKQWLEHVKQVCVGAYTNQDLPYEVLVQELNPERDRSRSPIFQAFFLFQDTRNRTDEFDTLRKSQVNVDRPGVQTDLDFWVKREGQGLVGGLEYPVELFERTTAEAFTNSFLQLLNSVVDNPDTRIANLTSAAEDEITAISGWNDTLTDFGEEMFLQRFKRRSEAHPNKLAVTSNDLILSYSELDERSSCLANFLCKEGVERNSLVGICMNRSIDMLVSLVAVWKARATYVPLDPDFPPARLQYMLEASAIKVIVTESSLTTLAEAYGCRRILIDSEWPAIEQMPADCPAVESAADDLAYVIFTSGSTGKPKGVQVPHGAVGNFLATMADQPGLLASDRLLAVTSLSFDIAVLELYLPLFVGACVVIATSEETGDGAKLKALIDQHRINIMQATPSTWRVLLASGWQGGDEFKVLCGGEAFPVDLAGQLLDSASEVWNMYGPTETTVWSTCCRLQAPLEQILIGRPIANTRCYILDAEHKQLPVGVAGELYIGGAGLATGYLNRKDLTKERFMPDPFSDEPGARLYQTGDLASWRREGQLVYFRRIDNQVKLRGYRIELGEVEAVLLAHPSIVQCAAMVRTYAETDQRLVAYVCFAAGQQLTNSDMRQFLRDTLPDYMLPQLFVELQTIPLTPNGKVDRNALPEAMQSLSQQQEIVPPRTEMERNIASIWAELLQTEDISIDDHFFDIGGHSLLALEVIYRLQDLYGVRVSPLDILINTLGQISAKVDQHSDSAQQVESAATEPGKKTGLLSRLLKR